MAVLIGATHGAQDQVIDLSKDMKRKYKRRMHIDSPAIDKFYFSLEDKIHPNYHNDHNYDYLMPLWKVACLIFRLRLRANKIRH